MNYTSAQYCWFILKSIEAFRKGQLSTVSGRSRIARSVS